MFLKHNDVKWVSFKDIEIGKLNGIEPHATGVLYHESNFAVLLSNFLKCKHHYLFHLIASPFAVCDLIQFLVPNIANGNISNKLELTLKRDHLSVLVSWFYRGSIHGLYDNRSFLEEILSGDDTGHYVRGSVDFVD